MATRQEREDEARRIVQPFIDDWREHVDSDWAAFRNFAVAQVLADVNLTEEQILEATLVDGANDFGIDAWWLETDEGRATLYLVQSKDTRATRDDLRKLHDGLESVMDPRRAFTANRPLQEYAAELRERLVPHLAIEMHLVSSKLITKGMRKNGEPLETGAARIQDRDYPVSYYTHDIESLRDNLRVEPDQPIQARFTVQREKYFELEPAGGLRSVSTAIKANELADLYNRHRINLFRENPRYYLGTKNPINSEMYQTLKDIPAYFYLYNNGLTGTCSAVNIREGGETVLELRDFQIVNGCQTTVTIHEMWRRGELGDKLQDVLVPIRIIEASNASPMVDSIAAHTNQQTAMKAEDFYSGARVHQGLHADFNRLSPKWFYENKRGTWKNELDARSRREQYGGGEYGPRKIGMKDLAQAALAFLNLPHEAFDKVGSYFADKKVHSDVFPEGIRAEQLLLPHVLLLRANKMAKINDQEAKVRGEENAWSRLYLKFPLVANVGNTLRYLMGIQGTEYLSLEEARRLLATVDEWWPILAPHVFSPLEDFFDRHALEGRAVRSMLRQGDWRDDAFREVKRKVDGQLATEAAIAKEAGLVPTRVGLRKALPIVLPSPGG